MATRNGFHDAVGFQLDRFLQAQAHAYTSALTELRQGKKRSHWIWYILPQLRGLGLSQMSHTYGITGLAEAQAYLTHPVLGPRLLECVQAIMSHSDQSAEDVLGSIDALKFQSCLTLFDEADRNLSETNTTNQTHPPSIFSQALKQFFAGQPDAQTLQRLNTRQTP